MRISFKPVIIILLNVAFFAAMSAIGQVEPSAKASKYFGKALEFYDKGETDACRAELDKVLREDSTYSEAYIMMGDLLKNSGDLREAAGQYEKALQYHPEREDVVYNLMGNTWFDLEEYNRAAECYRKMLEYPGINQELRLLIEVRINTAGFRQSLKDKPVAFDPVNLGPMVNSDADEYINTLTPEGDGIYFTRKSKNPTDPSRQFNEDFYFARFSGDSSEMAELLAYPPGKLNDAGALCISPDGRLLFFTACHRQDSYGSCDLYYSVKTGDKWSTARNLGPSVNTKFWDAQPSLSPDGRTLYFTSNRPGGMGDADLWKTERLDDGNWSKPVNLGEPVNTSGSEMAPFLHFDNQTLYFSSGGHPGMGGTDLFKSIRYGNKWSEPDNLGYPLNTAADELVIIVSAAGNEGFISNNNLGGEGGYDIYKFELDPASRPVPVTYLKGKVFDKESLKLLEARFELIDIEKDSLIISALSDRISGEFLVCLPCDRNYALNVTCEGYLFYSDHFPLSEIKSISDPVLRDIPLEPLAVGNSMVLRNIFFLTDQYEIMPESYPELDILFDFLKQNPAVKIEIGGHTDDQGTDDYNAVLSLKRAGSVAGYLEMKGIDPARMSYRGYGESMPVSSNDTSEGRALNRRTEIRITGMN